MERRITVKICTGTTCHLMGGHQLFDFEQRLPPEWRGHVDVQGAHCLGLCDKGETGRAPYAAVDGEVVADATQDKLADAVRRRMPQTEMR